MSFALPQFMQSPWNPLVWTALDNETDTRTSLIIYNGAVSTYPSDTGQYEVNCIMMHQAEKQVYLNTGTSDTPTWEAFGPGSALPSPLIPGTFLFTDGATVYWSPALVGQVQYNAVNLNQYGILNFNSFLVASNDVPNSRINVDLDTVALAADATFISTLEGNLDLANIGGLLDLSTQTTGLLDWTQIDQSSVLVDLSTQVTGVLNSTNIDITNLESTLDLGNIAGQIDLTTQVTGQLPAANIDVADLITQLNDNVTVAVDGVTITGDGTTGNPLVAVGGGGSAERKVGVGEITDATIFNAQLQFMTELWSAPTNRVTNINFSASQDAVTLVGVFPGVDGGSSAGAFPDSRLFIVEAIVYLNDGNHVGAFGFNPAGDTNAITISNNIEGAYFVGDGSGNLYIQTGTGAARTQTNLGAIAGGRQKLRIEFDRTIGTPAARFYRDGVLVGTITTNLPNSSVIGVTFQNGAGGTLIESAGCPSVAMEF